MIVADELELPPLPVAVAVYVVLLPGVTDTDPDGPTTPTPGSMSTDVALVVDQERLELCPAAMLLGVALN